MWARTSDDCCYPETQQGQQKIIPSHSKARDAGRWCLWVPVTSSFLWLWWFWCCWSSYANRVFVRKAVVHVPSKTGVPVLHIVHFWCCLSLGDIVMLLVLMMIIIIMQHHIIFWNACLLSNPRSQLKPWRSLFWFVLMGELTSSLEGIQLQLLSLTGALLEWLLGWGYSRSLCKRNFHHGSCPSLIIINQATTTQLTCCCLHWSFIIIMMWFAWVYPALWG